MYTGQVTRTTTSTVYFSLHTMLKYTSESIQVEVFTSHNNHKKEKKKAESKHTYLSL